MKQILLNYYFLLLLCCTPLYALAQVDADTLLPAVEITGLRHESFTAGVKRQQLDSLSLQLQRGQSLASLLNERSPLYLREYGPGQLTTLSFRGTGSSHTAVLWNGLNINSPTLGQTDFSQIPVFALENVQVQYGSSSALYGSDALGGSIQLETKPQQWQQGWGARLRQEAGSFGSYFTGLAGNWANKQWQTDVRVYRRSADNDFPYTNTLKRSQPRERNVHSAFWQQGGVAQLGYKPAANQEVWLQGWWQQGWRQVQPLIGSTTGSDEQQDEALRLNLQYRHILPLGEWQLQAGWIDEEMIHNSSGFRARQFIAKPNWETELTDKLLLQIGGQWNWRQATNENYKEQENRTEAFTRMRWQPSRAWVTSFNLRQIVTDQLWGPLSPSLGTEVALLPYLKAKASGGRHYRVPTLNDRFWPWFGQPALKPETGWNTEAGLVAEELNVFGGKLYADLTAYWLWINDWIMWRPTVAPGPDGEPLSGWGPKNLRSVYSRGYEASFSWQHHILEVGGNAAYTRSENRVALNQFDRTVNQQLPFVPLWKANSWIRAAKKGWLGELTGQYTSRRYTTGVEDNTLSLPHYYLLNLSAGKTWQLQNHSLGLLLQLRNLLDHQYQNYENRAMPGRSYTLTVNYIFNK
ncbi:outer membrane cobalamin receptor protein [Flammeovirgaceae bacterium 311]|nr:outer membrane cobalamin receptor protein [Flammeovirgaceae bacterium 311]